MSFINEINEENYKVFIEKYGKITDVETAKKLLCQTSNAWFILDDSIKINPEVIMYYQPMVKINLEGLMDFGVYDYIFSLYPTQHGFKKHGYFGWDFIPNIEFPEDFNFDKYLEVQHILEKESQRKICDDPSKLCASYVRDGINWVIKVDSDKFFDKTGTELKNISFDADRITLDTFITLDKEEVIYTVYDRSKLDDIVNSVLNKSDNKKR